MASHLILGGINARLEQASGFGKPWYDYVPRSCFRNSVLHANLLFLIERTPYRALKKVPPGAKDTMTLGFSFTRWKLNPSHLPPVRFR